MSAPDERRSAKRVALSVDVKFLLRGQKEGAGRLLDISEKGLALLADMHAAEGDPIIVYPLGLGRIEGKIVRSFDGGAGVSFTVSESQRKTIRERIEAALEGKPYMRLVEQRTELRIRYNIETTAWADGDDKPFACTIKDMSRSGCLLQSQKIPGLGAKVRIGALRGKVVRLEKGGFAVEFIRRKKPASPDKVENAA